MGDYIPFGPKLWVKLTAPCPLLPPTWEPRGSIRHQKTAFVHTKITALQLLILIRGRSAHLWSPKSYQTIPIQWKTPPTLRQGEFSFFKGCPPWGIPSYHLPIFFCFSACSIISRILRWKRLSCLGFFLFSWILAWILSSSKMYFLMAKMIKMVIRLDTK